MTPKLLSWVRRTYSPKIWLIGYLCDRVLAEYRDREGYFRGRLLDIGCGPKPYREFFSDVTSEHLGVDHLGTLHQRSEIDVFGSADALPLADESVDSALCTAVLEHLEEPQIAITECFRVLRAGGVAVYTVPFIWHLHEEPRDFFRFSRFGLRHLFEKAGFEILEIRALSGFWATFGQLLVYNLYRFNRGPLRWLGVIPLLGLVVQAGALVLNRLDRTEEWTWMYSVAARRPHRTGG